MKKIAIIHGPNLNLLGEREPEIYGSFKLEDINQACQTLAAELNVELVISQSNHEGDMVDAIHQAREKSSAIIINPAAYTHTSVAILDALKAVGIPSIEVHLSNVYSREDFRHKSFIAGVVAGRIMGFGPDSYLLALRAAKSLIAN